jgi:pimeloyl-ACP methyl ester carboxylesterase
VIPAHLDEGDGPPLVLLMGLGADGETWRPHLDAWTASFRCLAVDNRGAGRTPRGGTPPSTADLADDVVELLDALGLERVRVAGISMGAGIGQELALRHPERVERLVLVAPWARVDAATASTLEVLERARSSGDPRLFGSVLRNLIWTPEWIDAHAAEMEPGLGAPPTMTAEAFADQVAACRTHDTIARLGGILCPTLVTWGARDVFIRPDLSAETAAAIPGAETRVFATGHVHHWEELGAFNEEIGGWLR